MTVESSLLATIRLACSNGNVRLFRNNCGALQDANGRWVHYGLCDGSSDLVGWTVRNGVAVFTAIEVKAPRGRVTPEQAAFLTAVQRAGGIAGVCRSVDDTIALLRG